MKGFAPICFSYIGIILHFETRKILIGPAHEFLYLSHMRKSRIQMPIPTFQAGQDVKQLARVFI